MIRQAFVFLLSVGVFIQCTECFAIDSLSGRQWVLQNSNKSISLTTTLPAYPLEVLRLNKVIENPLYR